VQAVAEASEDPAIRVFMQDYMREVHGFVAGVIERAQATGGIERERNAAAEAWLFLAVGLLIAVGTWLGGLLDEDLPEIAASRRRWHTGQA
jgi:hypothetical protein